MTLILLDQVPTLMTSFNLNDFFIADIATLGVRASVYEFVGRHKYLIHNSQSGSESIKNHLF